MSLRAAEPRAPLSPFFRSSGLEFQVDPIDPKSISAISGIDWPSHRNLSFSGEVKLARKDTRFIIRDLPRLVQTAVGKLMDRWHHQDARLASYKLTDIDDCSAHDLVIRACDVGVCPDRHIPQVLQHWREPVHTEFESRNVWNLFNAFTEALKGNLVELPRRTEALHGLLDSDVGLALSS